MHRRGTLNACFLCAWMPIFGWAHEPLPNFVFILSDDQGWNGTSFPMDPHRLDSKSPYYETPCLAQLAREGMRFTRAYAPAARCCPTRRSIQFGKSPARQGSQSGFLTSQQLLPSTLTIPRVLKAVSNRYCTAHFGKWDLRCSLSPEDLGYDESDGNTGNREGNLESNFNKTEKWQRYLLTDAPKRMFELAARTKDFITRQAAAERPFFVQVSQYAVHADFHTRPQSYQHFSKKPSSDIHRNVAFAGMTADLDAAVGEILDHLTDLNLQRRTYVIYMADNGAVPWIPPDREKHLVNPNRLTTRSRNHPLRSGKWTLYEGGIRVPFLVRGPGVLPGSHTEVPIVGWDLLPTIASIAGYRGPFPDDLDGGSFEALLHRTADRVPRSFDALVFHRYSGSYGHSAIIEGAHKLIRFWGENKGAKPSIEATIQLFNLKEDLGERHNLADQKPETCQRLSAKLQRYLETVDAEILRDRQ